VASGADSADEPIAHINTGRHADADARFDSARTSEKAVESPFSLNWLLLNLR